jgi:hypothetical protein
LIPFPHLTVFSVITYATPASASNDRPCKTFSATDKVRGKIIHAKGIEHCDHLQPSSNLRKQPERYHVVRLSQSQQPISRYLVIFGQLIESEAALTEPLGDDVLKTDEDPAADEENVGRVEGKGGAAVEGA